MDLWRRWLDRVVCFWLRLENICLYEWRLGLGHKTFEDERLKLLQKRTLVQDNSTDARYALFLTFQYCDGKIVFLSTLSSRRIIIASIKMICLFCFFSKALARRQELVINTYTDLHNDIQNGELPILFTFLPSDLLSLQIPFDPSR